MARHLGMNDINNKLIIINKSYTLAHFFNNWSITDVMCFNRSEETWQTLSWGVDGEP